MRAHRVGGRSLGTIANGWLRATTFALSFPATRIAAAVVRKCRRKSQVADAVIEELYLTPERKRVPEVHLEIVRRLSDANSLRPPTDQLSIPSRRTVYRETAGLRSR